MEDNKLKIILIVFLVLGFVSLLSVMIVQLSKKDIKTEIGADRIKRRSILDTQQAPTLKSFKQLGVPDNQQYLMNFAPLTASVGGYIGEGVFDPEMYVKKALSFGIRSFVLPISTYIDDNKEPPLFPLSRKPAIVFRDETGAIASRNGMSITEFCKALMTQSTGSDEPLLLFLMPDGANVPDADREEDKYVKLMHDIAVELRDALGSSLYTYDGAVGPVVKGLREREILTQIPFPSLSKKILIFSGFDTSRAEKKAYNKPELKPSLHEYTNFCMTKYMSLEKKSMISPTVSTTTPSNASKMIRSSDILGSDTATLSSWAKETQTYFLSTLLDGSVSVPPNDKDVDTLLSAGIQVIPLPFFYTIDSNNTDNINSKMTALLGKWGGASWKAKPESIRFTRPPPIKPAAVSSKLVAVSPTSIGVKKN